MCVDQPYYMGCICGGNMMQLLQLANSKALFCCDAHRLITSQQKQNKKPWNKQLFYLTSNVWTVQENLETGQYGNVSIWDF